jgi:hypothetical protein
LSSASELSVTTDGHKAYFNAVEEVFGPEIDYAMFMGFTGQIDLERNLQHGLPISIPLKGSERRIQRVVTFNVDSLLEDEVNRKRSPRERPLVWPISRASDALRYHRVIPIYHLHGYLPYCCSSIELLFISVLSERVAGFKRRDESDSCRCDRVCGGDWGSSTSLKKGIVER